MTPDIKALLKSQADFIRNNPDIVKFWKEFESMSYDEKIKLKKEKEEEYESFTDAKLRNAFYIKYRIALRFG